MIIRSPAARMNASCSASSDRHMDIDESLAQHLMQRFGSPHMSGTSDYMATKNYSNGSSSIAHSDIEST
jgi:hypothetical protein